MIFSIRRVRDWRNMRKCRVRAKKPEIQRTSDRNPVSQKSSDRNPGPVNNQRDSEPVKSQWRARDVPVKYFFRKKKKTFPTYRGLFYKTLEVNFHKIPGCVFKNYQSYCLQSSRFMVRKIFSVPSSVRNICRMASFWNHFVFSRQVEETLSEWFHLQGCFFVEISNDSAESLNKIDLDHE